MIADVFVSEATMTVDELVKKTKQTDGPLYIGLSGKPEVVVWPIKRDLGPDQRAAVQAQTILRLLLAGPGFLSRCG